MANFDKIKVRELLKDAILLLCKNSLPYKAELNIEGLLGITIDNNDILLVNINEVIVQDQRSQAILVQPPKPAKRHLPNSSLAQNSPSLIPVATTISNLPGSRHDSDSYPSRKRAKQSNHEIDMISVDEDLNSNKDDSAITLIEVKSEMDVSTISEVRDTDLTCIDFDGIKIEPTDDVCMLSDPVLACLSKEPVRTNEPFANISKSGQLSKQNGSDADDMEYSAPTQKTTSSECDRDKQQNIHNISTSQSETDSQQEITTSYHVLHFLETDEIEIAPKSWMKDLDMVVWPPFTNSAHLTKAITSGLPPEKTWTECYKVKILANADSYKTAEEKMRIVETDDCAMTDRVHPQENPNKSRRIAGNSLVNAAEDTGNILTDIHVNTEEILQVVRLISQAYKEGVKLPSPVGMLCNANVPMPIKDDSCMEKLEEEIKDGDKRNAMIMYLCRLGGVNLRDMISRCMTTVFDLGFIAHWNWTGKGQVTNPNAQRRAFRETMICQVIIEAARNADYLPTPPTDKHAEIAIMKWLRSNIDRTSRKCKRDNTADYNEEVITISY